MKTRKLRKDRMFKKEGGFSYDLCKGCFSPGCDPSARHPKVERRLRAGLCPACGELWDFCKCKSGDQIKILCHNNRHKENYTKSRDTVILHFKNLLNNVSVDTILGEKVYKAYDAFVRMRFSSPRTVSAFIKDFEEMMSMVLMCQSLSAESLNQSVIAHMKFSRYIKK